jgi:hypothetical protein
MMRCKKGLLLVSLAALACSGRYEVGEMDPAGGGSDSAGGSTNTAGQGSPGAGAPPSSGGSGSAGSGSAGSGSVGSGNASAGGAAPSNCFTAVAPAPLAAPFIDPLALESRVYVFIFGQSPRSTPELPSVTSYEWAGEYVDEAFAMAIAETGGVPGGDYFVKQWLGIDATEVLEGDYGSTLVADDTSLLAALLQTDLGQGRTGAFSEKVWLGLKPSIPLRGLDMARNVFGLSIPAPPPNIDRAVDPTLQDRAALEGKINEPVCVSCHRMFTPLGYALGNFDAAGDYRSLDHDLPIDTSGSYPLMSGATLDFDGIADFGAKATSTCDANLGVVDRFLHVALTARGYGDESRYQVVDQQRERVQRAFIAGGSTYQALVRAYAQSPLVLY